jgi:hypothetical protein
MSFRNVLAPVAVSAVLLVPGAGFAQTLGSAAGPGAGAARSRYTDAPVSQYDVRRSAYDEGYREGIRTGEQDARRGDRFDYQDEGDFRRGDKGYHRSYGDRERYRQIFRDGFASGYSDGYSRFARNDRRPGSYPSQGPYAQRGGYGGWGGGGSYSSPAFGNGTQDGYEKGLEDARKNRSFDPHRHSWYRSGDRHFEGRYGSRDRYKDVYRQGFQQGYERGYREYRYRR